MEQNLLFKILGLKKENNRDGDKIKNQCRKMSLKYILDNNEKAEKDKYTVIQKAINIAYEILNEPESRYQYENYGFEGLDEEEERDWSFLSQAWNKMDESIIIIEDEEEEKEVEPEKGERKEEENDKENQKEEEIINHRARPIRRELKFLIKDSKFGEYWIKDQVAMEEKENLPLEYLGKLEKEKKKSFQLLMRTQEKLRE